jgi:hypothetical protein
MRRAFNSLRYFAMCRTRSDRPRICARGEIAALAAVAGKVVSIAGSSGVTSLHKAARNGIRAPFFDLCSIETKFVPRT